ncbi:ATP-grasp domain-containing protein [Mangrovimonas sp. TPBH4]|uniref:ATP-grasp domain-containing protein n=1 Tax=Mangrovimonas sp. TPBH4 TaxID=1645914 RepID=UPI0006B4B9DE|nr:ATP-grasp domain-containing protein [Mangrovimonas sp. TPBH4]
MINILFTCAGRRTYLINYFKQALNGDGIVYAGDLSASAPAMVEADRAILFPSIYSNNYIDELKSAIKKHNINAVISLNDLELPLISRHKEELESTGTKVIISDERVIDIAYDKLKTHNFIQSIGLNSPLTYNNLDDTKKALEKKELNFPLVVKPRWGSASKGLEFANNMEELELIFKLQKLKLKTTCQNFNLPEKFKELIIQEKIPGQEFGMDIVNDLNGNYIGTFVRKKLYMRSGETDKAISVIDQKFEDCGQQISKYLGHVGNLDCDVFLTNNKLYILELNPRFGGGYPFSHEAGVNTSAMYIEWLKGNSDISRFMKYKPNIMYSKCDRLLRIN